MALLVASPFVGSFLGLVAARLPRREMVLAGRSHCDACNHQLRVGDLVPLASYALLRGRCRYCGAPIDPFLPGIELAAFAVALWALLATPGWIMTISCALGWTLLPLATIDWRTGYLPDVLTLPLAVAGLGIAYAIEPASVVDHAIGAGAGLAGFAALAFAYRWIRGRDGLGLGDAKLLGAGGAWVAWQGLATVILFAAVIGLALVLMRRRSGVAPTDRIAFGPAVAAAIWLVWLYGPLVPA